MMHTNYAKKKKDACELRKKKKDVRESRKKMGEKFKLNIPVRTAAKLF